MQSRQEYRLAVVIPCYKSADKVLGVIAKIGPEVAHIVCVDDSCPEGTGRIIERQATDSRLHVVFHETNQGVGGAVCTGYAAALALGADIIIKVDSDGQMDPVEIPTLIHAIVEGYADYTKGNRFFNIEDVAGMPTVRLIGNAGLSFLTKLSSGYWTIFDPTNGYTAIHARVLERIPLERLARRYFFESDLLFRLGTLRACVVDVPIPAIYADERSNMRVQKMILYFFRRNIVNLGKRLFYNYFLRNFSVASVLLVLGTILTVWGVASGIDTWISDLVAGRAASSGQVMLAALPIIVGVQMMLAFLAYDVESEPRIAIHRLLLPKKTPPARPPTRKPE
jgi:glycosyltransferase involved in cell wall biosynthesis